MPEYLAPGVYVEETSFRSKSIEGVSTSTTAFVGLARKGIVTSSDTSPTPEIVTSYVDFERVFGGFEDIELETQGGVTKVTNYLAHAVNAFFSNGGSRLYVARVAAGDALAATSALFLGASFKARFAGSAGNGRLILSLSFAPLTDVTWKTAPVGTVARVRGGLTPTVARLTGQPRPRFFLHDADTLQIEVNGAAQAPVTFLGKPAEAAAADVLAATVTIDASNEEIEVDVDGLAQSIRLTQGVNRTRAVIVADINQKLAGGFAYLDATDHLVLATDSRGTASKITVTAAPALGFTADTASSPPAAAANNVKNLLNVDLADLKQLLEPLGLLVEEVVAEDGQRTLVLSTVATGATAGIEVTAGPVQQALGLPTDEVSGSAGSLLTHVVKAMSGDPLPGNPGDRLDAISVAITAIDKDGHARLYEDMGLDHRHPRFVGKVLVQDPKRRSEQLENLFYLESGNVDGVAWADALAAPAVPFARVGAGPEEARLERQITLGGGTDGGVPTSPLYKTALEVLERLEDISIVAAPGYSALNGQADAIELELLAHVEKRRSYRIGVLDSRPGDSIGQVRDTKARVDSKYAALYYPWIIVQNPLWRAGDASIPREIAVPPSGFVSGIYARTDVERGVFKAPANEVVRGALRFETDVNFAQQEVLNPLGVNCLRFFPGRGYRVWGARTTSSDSEWKYVSVRRYFNYLERSIDVSTQWAVFEPNGERLWANVRETISSFLHNEWRSGALLGTDPKEAFFVRCDRSTMDQNDLDNGRLVCLIGVAVVKPAEFVIFRIGQKTADARS